MGSSVSALSGNVVDGGSWRKAATSVDTKALKDFLIIFFFTEGLCVVWMGQLPPMYPLCMYLYVCAHQYVFLIVIYVERIVIKIVWSSDWMRKSPFHVPRLLRVRFALNHETKFLYSSTLKILRLISLKRF